MVPEILVTDENAPMFEHGKDTIKDTFFFIIKDDLDLMQFTIKFFW